MKPDFIDNVSEEDIKIGGETPSESPTKVVFSCISLLEEKQLNLKKTNFLKILEGCCYYSVNVIGNEGYYFEYIRSTYEPRFAFVHIGFPEEFFAIKNYRRFIHWLCELLQTDACTLITKSKGEQFYKDMLSNDYLKAHPDDKNVINEQFESLKNDNHEELKIKEVIQGVKFYLCESLLIRNIDVLKPLSIDVIEYASKITNKGINGRLHFPYPEDVTHHMMFFKGMKPNLPILLKKDMPEYKERWGDDIDRRYIPEGNVLGYYTRDDIKFKGPHIVLGPEEIEKSAEEMGISFHILFSMVLVHELAHAFMDKFREVAERQLKYDYDKNIKATANWPCTLETKAMEESLANKITLDWFKKYAPKDAEQVRCYIDKQPTIYRFGIYQDKIDADWKKWRESAKQNTTELIEWFNKCFSDGEIKIPLDDYSREDYDKAF